MVEEVEEEKDVVEEVDSEISRYNSDFVSIDKEN